jgi:hypothetical protein
MIRALWLTDRKYEQTETTCRADVSYGHVKVKKDRKKISPLTSFASYDHW